HVVATQDLPAGVKQVSADGDDDVTNIQIDPHSWETITNAMADVVNPVGTAPSAHLQNIDFAGKTGSAQVISNSLRAKLSGHQFKDNGWFAGVAPRRNPEIVVCTLIEQGEHGYLAARIASQVIKAYVEKQRKLGRKTAGLLPEQSVEIGGVWSKPGDEG